MPAALIAMLLLLQQVPEPECRAISTYEMMICAGNDLVRAEQRMERYLAEAKRHVGGQRAEETRWLIDESQAAWRAYVDVECGAIRHSFGSGSVAPLMEAGCRRHLIDKRTHAIWRLWLVPMADSEPPFLPEPEPTPHSNASRNPID